MKKTILILLFINSFLNADYQLTVQQKNNIFHRCITTYSTDDSRIYYTKSSTNTNYYISTNGILEYKIDSGYTYSNNGKCEKISGKLSNFEFDSNLPMNADNLSYLGLTNSDLNLMLSFSGLLISSIFLFGLFRFI